MPFPSNQCQQVQPEEIPNVSITQRVSPLALWIYLLDPLAILRIRRTRSSSLSSLPPFFLLSFRSFVPFSPIFSLLCFDPRADANKERVSAWPHLNTFYACVLSDLLNNIILECATRSHVYRNSVNSNQLSIGEIEAGFLSNALEHRGWKCH